MHILGALDAPSAGQYFGWPRRSTSDYELPASENKIGFVFQL